MVIKQIDPRHSQNPAFVKMFLDEARLAASLHHHNIIQVHDIGKEGETYFFAMEYIHGEDLRKVLCTILSRKEKTPLEHAVTIVTAAASALHYAHDHCGPDRKPLNLVHRDVSPSNILIAFDGNVKVVDFGIAKTAMATTETRVGDIKGKFSHMSPEQCLGKPLDRRSDVFALGIVLYELVTVRAFVRGESDFEKMKVIIEGTVEPPSKYRPGLPPELDTIILKALARDPAQRYQSAEELRVALERFAIMNNLRSSTSALADYMKSLFGERREPWNVTSQIATFAKPRQKAITEGYADIVVVPEAAAPLIDTDASKTPMAWAAVQTQPATAPRKRRLPLLAAALALPLAIMGVAIMRSSSNADSTRVAAANARSASVAPAPAAASNPVLTVASATQPGAAAPAATPTANGGAAPTSPPAPAVSSGTQSGSAAPIQTIATPAATPEPELTTTLQTATTADPTNAKKPTVQPAKRVARTKQAAKQPKWDPDALTPE